MGAQVQWGIPTGLIYQWPHKGLNQQPTSVWTGFQDVPATSIATLELKYLTQKALALPEILCQNEITTTDQCIIHRGVPGSTQSLPKFTRYSQTSEVETHIYTSVHVYVYIYIFMYIIDISTYGRIHIHMHITYTHTHTYTHTYTCKYTHTYTHTYTFTYTCTYTHTYTPTHTHKHRHRHTHLHIHTNIDIEIYTYTYAPA